MRLKYSFILIFYLILQCNLLYSGTWDILETQSPPFARTGHTAVYDAESRSMIIMGDEGCIDSSIHYLDLNTNAWIVGISSDTIKRIGHSMVYDTNKKRVIVFGGSIAGRGSVSGYENKTYVWNFGTEDKTWELLITIGTVPSERVDHSAIYDTKDNKMIIFGGIDNDRTYLNDVYALDLTQTPPVWSEISPTGGPPRKRFRHTAIYDPTNNRMLIFGGTSSNAANNDLWSLDLTTIIWTQLSPSGDAPPYTSGHTAVYDPDEPATGTPGSMIIFGGTDPLIIGKYKSETYILYLNQMIWKKIQPGLNPPSGRAGHVAVYDTDVDGKRMVIFGGYDGTNNLNSCYTLNITDFWPPSSGTSEVFNYPNPFAAGVENTNICFYLDSPSRVSIKIFTLVGDLVKKWSVDGERGANEVVWDGRNGEGKLVENGGYICVVDTSRSISRFKISVLK